MWENNSGSRCLHAWGAVTTEADDPDNHGISKASTHRELEQDGMVMPCDGAGDTFTTAWDRPAGYIRTRPVVWAYHHGWETCIVPEWTYTQEETWRRTAAWSWLDARIWRDCFGEHHNGGYIEIVGRASTLYNGNWRGNGVGSGQHWWSRGDQ